MTEADKEFMRFAIMPTYRHEYLGMLEDLKNARSHFPGGYEFLRKNCEVRINAWTMLDIRKSLLPCDDVTAYALEGIRFGIDMANKPSVTVKAKVEVDPKVRELRPHAHEGRCEVVRLVLPLVEVPVAD